MNRFTAKRGQRVSNKSVQLESLEGRTLFSSAMTWDHAAVETAKSTAPHLATPMVHAASRRAVAVPATIHNNSTSSNFFPIGVFYQPTYLMDHWKSAGVNTMFGYESEGGSVSETQWDSAATSEGLYMIRQPGTSAAADRSDPYLLGYLLGDEPDGNNVPAKTLQAEYAALKKSNPTIPVVANFSGGYVLHWQGNVTSKTYSAYLQAEDWVSSDVYPVTGWGLPGRLDAPGQAVTTLSKASGGKPQFAFIETSNQNLSWVPNDQGVTPGQFDVELWTAINHGAKGIVYFPQQIGGFSYDATPVNVLAEMTTQDARIAAIGGALESTYDPATLGLSLTNGLQGSWRSYGGEGYLIVTNPTNQTINGGGHAYGLSPSAASAAVSGENRSITLNGGVFTDTFAPYQTHIYVVG